MTPQIERQMHQIREILQNNPGDANAYILLRAMIDLLQPIHVKILESTDTSQSMVAKQIKLIMDIAFSIIVFLDVKKANLK